MGDKIRRALTVLTAAVLILAGAALPAQAAVMLHGCDERSGIGGRGMICLYDRTGYSKSGRWAQYDLLMLAQQPGGCLTMFNVPADFGNVASSFAYNPSYAGQIAMTGKRLKFWNGTYCTGASTTWDADTERADSDLSTTKRYGNISNWASSISIN